MCVCECVWRGGGTNWQKEKKDIEGGGRRWAGRRRRRLWTEGGGGGGLGMARVAWAGRRRRRDRWVEHWLTQREGGSGSLANTKRRREWITG